GSLASWESDTGGALIDILATTTAHDGAAAYVGGVLDMGSPSGPPMADVVLQVSLLPQDANGRSRVRVSCSGAVSMPTLELRIPGSGPQRLRRAAFSSLVAVLRLRPSDRRAGRPPAGSRTTSAVARRRRRHRPGAAAPARRGLRSRPWSRPRAVRVARDGGSIGPPRAGSSPPGLDRRAGGCGP